MVTALRIQNTRLLLHGPSDQHIEAKHPSAAMPSTAPMRLPLAPPRGNINHSATAERTTPHATGCCTSAAIRVLAVTGALPSASSETGRASAEMNERPVIPCLPG